MPCCGNPDVVSTTQTTTPPPTGDACLRAHYLCVCILGVDTWVLDAGNSGCVPNSQCTGEWSCSDTESLLEQINGCPAGGPVPPLPVPPCDPHCCGDDRSTTTSTTSSTTSSTTTSTTTSSTTTTTSTTTSSTSTTTAPPSPYIYPACFTVTADGLSCLYGFTAPGVSLSVCGPCRNPTYEWDNGSVTQLGDWTNIGACVFSAQFQVLNACDGEGNIDPGVAAGFPFWVANSMLPTYQPTNAQWVAATASHVAWVLLESDCSTVWIYSGVGNPYACSETAPGSTDWTEISPGLWQKWYTRNLPCYEACAGGGAFECWGTFNPNTVVPPPCGDPGSVNQFVTGEPCSALSWPAYYGPNKFTNILGSTEFYDLGSFDFNATVDGSGNCTVSYAGGAGCSPFAGSGTLTWSGARWTGSVSISTCPAGAGGAGVLVFT